MFAESIFDAKKWAFENFSDCELGDSRRTDRLVQMAEQVVNRPAASLPKIGQTWSGVKGIYRLLDRPEATINSMTATHRQKVTSGQGRFLILSDTTHVDFGKHRQIKDAGPIGRGKSKGFLLHSGLFFDPQSNQLVGLGGQVSHVRTSRRGKQNSSQLLKRWRESEMWPELMEQIGSPGPDRQYIYVCDSAADNFEVYCTARRLGCDVVVRAGRQHRNVITPSGEKMPLSEYVEQMEEVGHYDLHLQQGNGRKARTAHLTVRSGHLTMPRPSRPGSRAKQWNQPVQMSVVVVQEDHPPRGIEPIRWILLTTLGADRFESAWEVIENYERRWLVEEWHKALKTGCRLESRQLQDIDRLLPLTGILSVVAVMLVQLKTVAREAPQIPAQQIVPELWLTILTATGQLKTKKPTIYQFWRAIARLGGFLGRKSDGEPGWQTIWSGWIDLHRLIQGAEMMKANLKRCG